MMYHYFYPRSPCGERQQAKAFKVSALRISIHALLAESDNLRVVDGSRSSIISIHALLAESDCFDRIMNVSNGLFLSTLSLRRATELNSSWISSIKNFYPRSPCGERPVWGLAYTSQQKFLSTLSLRRATDCVQYCIRAREISIHALLAESDWRNNLTDLRH